MEDKKSEGLLNVINPKKKMVAPKKDKDAEAKAKVEQLLKNTSVSGLMKPDKPEFDIEEIKQEKNSKWMEEQIDLLNKQVEEQENEILRLNDMCSSLTATGSVNNGGDGKLLDSQLTPAIVELFRHFETLHMRFNQDGNFQVRISYPVSGHGILDEFLNFLPELQSIRRYQHTNNNSF